MSATMTSDDKYIYDSMDEELSTSAGSSDNEVVPTSGDDDDSTTSSNHVEKVKPRHCGSVSKKGFLACQVCALLSTLSELFAILSSIIFSIISKPQPRVQVPHKEPRARVVYVSRPQSSKVRFDKTSKSFVPRQSNCRPPPPPGLNQRQSRRGKENQRPLQVVGPPPGLEGFLPPPGLQPPHAAVAAMARGKQPKQVTRGRKQLPIGSPPNDPFQQQATPPAPSYPLPPREFEQATYRKELSDVLRSLATGGNVPSSVQRIRAQNVPKEKQAAEFADILTRAAEDNRGCVRRLSFALAVGLTVGEQSAFDHEECERGLEFFFLEVFDDLAAEVPRLRNKIANELVPTLRTGFSEEQLNKIVPPDCRSVLC